MISGHGDDGFRYGGKIKMNFSSNLPGFADLSGLKAHLATKLDVIGTYPEPEATTLEAMLADDLNIPQDCIMVTAGATEAIYLIAQLFRDWASVIPQPTFSEYEEACRINGHIMGHYDDERERLPDRRVYWLCNPNNPTGNVMLKPFISHLVKQQRKYVFVVDQSYEHYTMKEMLHPREMQDCPNLFLLHSMTKQYAVPGLRLGYVTASSTLIAHLRQLRQPWAVNALAIEAGKYLVGNHVEVIPDKQAYLEEAQRLHAELSQLPSLSLMDSDTNFMLVRLENGEAPHLKQWLIEHHGILIRDASNFHGLDNHHFRVSAQTPAENDTLVAAIKAYLSQLA